MNMRRTVAASLAFATIAALLLRAPPARGSDTAYVTDPAGDAGGNDALDLLQGGLSDDGKAFTTWIKVKDLGTASPDPSAQDSKLGWRFHIEGYNATDPTKTRKLYVVVQVNLKNDQGNPATASPVANTPLLGISAWWGLDEADGTTPVKGSATGTVDTTANRITASLDFLDFKTSISPSAQPKVDLAKDGKVGKLWLESMHALSPSQTDQGNGALPAWTTADKAEQYTPYRLQRESATSSATSTGTTSSTSTSRTSSATATTISGLANATTNPPPATAASVAPRHAGGLPTPTLGVVLLAITSLALALRRR